MNFPQFRQSNFPTLLLFVGLYLGIIQSALFFTVQVFVSATYTGYFAIVLTWSAGVIAYMKFGPKRNLLFTLVLSLSAYYLLLIYSTFFTTSLESFLPALILIFISAFPVGELFKEYSQKISSDLLLFHENNGFILGLIFGMICFVKFGVNFLYFIPAAGFILALINYKNYPLLSIGVVTLLLVVTIIFDFYLASVILGITVIVAIFTFKSKLKPASMEGKENSNTLNILKKEQNIILLLSGFNLIILQYYITREFSSILSANELTILIIGSAYLLGFSIGYIISSRIEAGTLKIAAFALFFIHFFILVFVKSGSAYLIISGYNIESIVGLLFLTSFLTSSFYSIFLPKIVEQSGALSFVRAYIWELLGAAGGVIFMLLIISISSNLVLPVYLFVFVLIIYLLINKTAWAYSVFFIGIFSIGLFIKYQEIFSDASITDYYRTRGFSEPVVVFADNSYYQSVEVIDTYGDKGQVTPISRVSFLNGVRYFEYEYDFSGNFSNPTTLSESTYLLAEVPARYLFESSGKKLRVLILGGGSLYSINRVSRYSKKTTVVEIDPVVIESAKQSWSEFNRYHELDNYEIVIDDAKHYLKNTSEKFDLIVMNISAPYYLSTALLHNKDFFKLVSTKLRPDGIFSESTQSRALPNQQNSVSMKILNGLHDTFPKYKLIDCSGSPFGMNSFVYSSLEHDVDTTHIAGILLNDDKKTNTKFYDKDDGYYNFLNTVPSSLSNMEFLFEENVKRLNGRLRLHSRWANSEEFFKSNQSSLRYLKFNTPLVIGNVLKEKIFLLLILFAVAIAVLLRYLPRLRPRNK